MIPRWKNISPFIGGSRKSHWHARGETYPGVIMVSIREFECKTTQAVLLLATVCQRSSCICTTVEMWEIRLSDVKVPIVLGRWFL